MVVPSREIGTVAKQTRSFTMTTRTPKQVPVEELKQVGDQCATQAGKNAFLEMQLKQLQAELQDVRTTNSRLLLENKSLQTLNTEAKKKIVDLESENASWSMAYEVLNGEKKENERLLYEEREECAKLGNELEEKENEIKTLTATASKEQLDAANVLLKASTIQTLQNTLKIVKNLSQFHLSGEGILENFGGNTLGNRLVGTSEPKLVVLAVSDVDEINQLLVKNRIYKNIVVASFEIGVNGIVSALSKQTLEKAVGDKAFRAQLVMWQPVLDLMRAYTERQAQSRLANPGDTGLKNILSRLAASQLGTHHAVITFAQSDGTPYMGMVVSRLQAKQTQDGRRHLILDLQSEDAQRNVAYPLSTLGSHDRILKEGQFTLAVYDRDVMLRNEPSIPYSLSETGTRQGEGAVLDTVNGVRLYTTDVAASRSRLDMLVIPY